MIEIRFLAAFLTIRMTSPLALNVVSVVFEMGWLPVRLGN
jgi:hypothetical protein